MEGGFSLFPSQIFIVVLFTNNNNNKRMTINLLFSKLQEIKKQFSNDLKNLEGSWKNYINKKLRTIYKVKDRKDI